MVDLNSLTGSLLGAVLVFVIFCTKEEEYPLKTNTYDRCFFSPSTDGLVTRSLPSRTDTSQYSAEDGVNHILLVA